MLYWRRRDWDHKHLWKQLTELINQVRSRLIFIQTSFCNQWICPLLVSRRNAGFRHFHIGSIFLNWRLLPGSDEYFIVCLYVLMYPCTHKRASPSYCVCFMYDIRVRWQSTGLLRGNNICHLWAQTKGERSTVGVCYLTTTLLKPSHLHLEWMPYCQWAPRSLSASYFAEHRE